MIDDGDSSPPGDEANGPPPSEVPGRIAAQAAGAVLGAALAGPLGPWGGILGAGLTPIFEMVVSWDQRAWQRAETSLREGAVEAGLTPQELADWAKDNDDRLRLTIDVVEAAMHARDDATITALARVLADGCADDARLDVDQLYVAALREMRPADIQVLRVFVREINDRDDFSGMVAFNVQDDGHLFEPPPLGESREYSLSHMRDRLPQLEEGMEFIFATLVRLGCLVDGTPRQAIDGGSPFFIASKFGRSSLDFLDGRHDKERSGG
ncbi:hypothetical protein AB4Z14_03880 [Terrabacter sp. 2TAF16]|uniref:hypothetical protein n=1 Tax=Terrabacter sp. 2TAF16 TaxID=3233008 RepID=UPI003F98E143